VRDSVVSCFSKKSRRYVTMYSIDISNYTLVRLPDRESAPRNARPGVKNRAKEASSHPHTDKL
jgi:hypothetical protein